MAITKVTGRIGRTFYDGKGAEVIESWQQGGETMTKRWSVFFNEPHGLTEEDQVEVSGIHGDKIDEWDKDGEKRRTIKRTLSRARLVGEVTPPAAAVASQSEPDSTPWVTAEIPDNPWPEHETTPF
jgi:hypothetical protein